MAGNRPSETDNKKPDKKTGKDTNDADKSSQGKNGGNQDNKNPSPPQPGGMKFTRGLMLWMILIACAMIVFVFFSNQQRGQEIGWDELHTLYNDGWVESGSVVIRSSTIEAIIKPGSPQPEGPVRVAIGGPSVYEYYFMELDKLTGKNFKDRTNEGVWIRVLIGFLPWLLLLVIIWFFFFRSMRSAGGGAGMFGNFGRSKHRVLNREHTNIKFPDVAGIDEAKEELQEIVEFLKSPKKFQKLGGRIPRGVLLNGPPGCGKTLLARAIAGEADVPFFSISGSDFVEMFVGVGASRVRDLFKQAKESSPCIIFLDEIDAVGRKRGSGFASGGNDEREQTLNAILVEMDGFESNDQVIVIAATNRSDVLDPALTRPGRFDRQVMVPLPDLNGRTEILKVHSRNVIMSPAVELERVARGTPMFSGADLAAVINEAAIIATMAGKDFVELEDLEEARDKIKFGRERKSRVVEEIERVATAYHEAGHAVAQALLKDSDPLHKVTIIPRGNYGGATFSLPEKDRYGFGLKYLKATMQVLCGGRIAEERATSDISSGASQDISQVTAFARMMILEWGMSDKLGFVKYAPQEGNEYFGASKEYSDGTARLIDEEIKLLADSAYADCNTLLEEHWEQVKAVADALLQYETLTADEVHKLMRGDQLDKPTISSLLDKEHQKGNAENHADQTDVESADDTNEPEADTDLTPSPA